MQTQTQDYKQESSTTLKQPERQAQISSPSTRRSQNLSRRWRKPANVKDFVAQINQVSTMILNNELDLDTANAYSRLTRNFAQLMTTETVKARFLKRQPDLNLSGDVFEDNTDA